MRPGRRSFPRGGAHSLPERTAPMSSLSTDDAPAPSEIDGHSPEAVRAVRELVGLLVRTLKTLRLYDARNPMYKKALRDMAERFRAHVATYGGFTIRVERERLQYGGESLHSDEDPKEGLAFRLYTDGVRGITFQPSVAAEEIKTALEILSRGTALASHDDDIVTLFWSADLPSIEVEAVEDEPPDVVLTPAMGAEGGQPDFGAAVAEAGTPEAAPRRPERVEFGPDALSVFVLGPKEQSYVQQLVDREAGLDPVEDLVDILAGVLAVEAEDADFAETVDICSGLLVEFLSTGRLTDARRLVRALGSAAEERPALGAEGRRAVAQVLEGLGEGGLLSSLRDGLRVLIAEAEEAEPEAGEKIRARTAEDLRAYLEPVMRVDPRAVLEAAAEFADLPVRQALCDVVARVCKEDRAILFEMILETDPLLVECALNVIGRIGTASDLPRLAAANRSPDASVRRAAMDAVCKIAGGAHAQLYPYLTDPESRIRRRALAMIEVSGFRQALDTLIALVPRPVFAGWELNERRAVFNAIGVLGGDDTIGFFTQHLGRKRLGGLIGGRKDEDLALCAVAGLKAIGTPAARDVLRAQARQGSRKVRSACEWAQREMGAL
jgi:hypothetical protein